MPLDPLPCRRLRIFNISVGLLPNDQHPPNYGENLKYIIRAYNPPKIEARSGHEVDSWHLKFGPREGVGGGVSEGQFSAS